MRMFVCAVAAFVVPMSSTAQTMQIAATPVAPPDQNDNRFLLLDKWSLDNSSARCVVIGNFASPNDKLKLTITTNPLDANVDVEIDRQSQFRSNPEKGSTATFTTNGSSQFVVPYEIKSLKGRGHTAARLKLDRAELSSLATSPFFSMQLAENESVSIVPTSIRQVIQALNSCESQLLGAVSYTPKTTDSLATVRASTISTGNEDWIQSSDYPSGMGQTRVILGFIIGIDGRVHNCHALTSTPDPRLPDGLCAGLSKRARFKPAIDDEGNSVPSFWARTITLE